MEDNKIAELEARIKTLEEYISKINFSEAKDITIKNCPIGDIWIDSNQIAFQNCPIGSVIDKDIDEAEDRLYELEDRLSDIIDQIDKAKTKTE